MITTKDIIAVSQMPRRARGVGGVARGLPPDTDSRGQARKWPTPGLNCGPWPTCRPAISASALRPSARPRMAARNRYTTTMDLPMLVACQFAHCWRATNTSTSRMGVAAVLRRLDRRDTRGTGPRRVPRVPAGRHFFMGRGVPGRRRAVILAMENIAPLWYTDDMTLRQFNALWEERNAVHRDTDAARRDRQ